jgi:MoaA/NifB/PqqE/SkfB family radical SAM enzyme
MVARLTKKEEPEVAELLRGLQLIRVNVIGLNEENRAEIQERVKTIRAELDAQGWESIVTAQQKNEDVRIYLKIRGDEAVQGLVVTVLEGNKQAVLVNIVGDIKPEKLAEVGEQFNIDPLKKIGRGLKKDGAAQK